MARDKRYPENWAEISRSIRYGRAKGRCEARWDGVRCPHREGNLYPKSHGRIRLYCHHLGIPRHDGRMGDPRDKMDVRPENLLAVCYPCHVRLDAPLLKEQRKAERERRTREAWAKRGWMQLSLPIEGAH